MIENHTSCIRVSDTHICSFCYSSKIVKNGTTETKKQQYPRCAKVSRLYADNNKNPLQLRWVLCFIKLLRF